MDVWPRMSSKQPCPFLFSCHGEFGSVTFVNPLQVIGWFEIIPEPSLPRTKQAQVSVSHVLGPGPSWPWAGLCPRSEPGHRVPLLTFTSTKWRWGWAVTADPGLRSQFPKFLFWKPWVHFALLANYLQLNIHHCARSSPAGLLLRQSPSVVNPALYRAFHLLNPMEHSPALPKSGFFNLYLLEDKSVTLI